MFVGRERELELLSSLWDKSTASLVSCRGRRRIGKTEFIVLTDMARHGQKAFIADGGSKDDAKAALSAAGKVCRRLDKVA